MGVAASAAARAAMEERHAQAASCVMGPLAQKDAQPRVVFYRLRRKFVSTEESVSEASRNIVYYTLAVGHHTGTIDCFEEELICLIKEYEQVIELLPEGLLRSKLAGVLRLGEVQIDRTHVGVLREELFGVLARGCASPSGVVPMVWLERFLHMLDDAVADPAVYYMGRLRS